MSNKCFANEEIIKNQADNLGVSTFLEKSNEYSKNTFPELDINGLFNEAIKGKLNVKGFWGWIIDLLDNELKTAISSMISILIIVVIHGILKTIIESLGNEETSKIAYFIQYLIIVTLVTTTFVDMLNIVIEAITNVINFMNLLVPILITLMLTTGSIITSGTTQGILLFVINIMGNLINFVIVPLILISTALSIVSNFSDKVHVDRLSKFIKSAIVWGLGVVLTIFVGTLSIEGTLSSSVDGLTAKTAKVAVSTFIPVVGKVMGDTVETVIGCAKILKNAVGAIGLVILISIIVLPIIKITIMWALIRLIAALCETVADNKIVKLFDAIADSYKILFGILISVSIMFIVGITVVLKMTSIG